MTVAEYIADFIEEKKMDFVFQYPGGMITHMIDAIGTRDQVKIYSLLHEQSIAFAVSAVGRLAHLPSIAFATSGPGATNLLTGIGDCYFDSVPALFITGQVNTHELKGDSGIRQLGFQETDIVSMAMPITKLAIQITDPNQIVEVLEEAYQLAISGRPGPILIDIPMNIQRTPIHIDLKLPSLKKEPICVDLEEKIAEVIEILKSAKAPLFWIGNGIHTSKSESLFIELNKILHIPVVTSLHAIDLLASTDPNKVGMIGAYGNRWSNMSIKHADCIIFLGTRIDIRQTGANISIFDHIKTIRVDNTDAELANRVQAELKINVDLDVFLKSCIDQAKKLKFSFSDWHRKINSLKQEYPIQKEISISQSEINPHELFQKISNQIKGKTIYCADVGSHQMWAAQSLFFKKNDRFLTSGGMGSMGFCLPASIGAALYDPLANVVAIIGDGSFQMNIQELHSIFQHNLNIKIIIINNHSLGMIRQFQDTNFKSRHFGTVWGYTCPDFCKVAKSYQIPSKRIEDSSNVDSGVAWLLKGKGPKLLEVLISGQLNVYPKIAFGQTMDKMEPEFTPIAVEST
jgi:acetolactate synthase-1/2/3 large subunit